MTRTVGEHPDLPLPENGYDEEGKPVAVEHQTVLDEPLKIALTGKLRDRVGERQGQYVPSVDSNDYDAYSASCYRVFFREKTNLVMETEEEVYWLLRVIDWYATPGITWMNGPMLKAAQRVDREVRDYAEQRDIEIPDRI